MHMSSVSRRRRTIFAAILAPLIIPVLFLSAMLLVSGYTDQGPGYAAKLIPVTLSIGIVSYVFSFLGGVPIILILNRWHRLTICYGAFFSAIAGLLGGVIFVISHPVRDQHEPLGVVVANGLAVAFASVSVAITFGLVAGMPICRRLRTP